MLLLCPLIWVWGKLTLLGDLGLQKMHAPRCRTQWRRPCFLLNSSERGSSAPQWESTPAWHIYTHTPQEYQASTAHFELCSVSRKSSGNTDKLLWVFLWVRRLCTGIESTLKNTKTQGEEPGFFMLKRKKKAN